MIEIDRLVKSNVYFSIQNTRDLQKQMFISLTFLQIFLQSFHLWEILKPSLQFETYIYWALFVKLMPTGTSMPKSKYSYSAINPSWWPELNIKFLSFRRGPESCMQIRRQSSLMSFKGIVLYLKETAHLFLHMSTNQTKGGLEKVPAQTI